MRNVTNVASTSGSAIQESRADESAQAPAAPAANRRAKSKMPGPLRDLTDKVTGRAQSRQAARLSDEALQRDLENPDLSGRMTRAVQREAARRQAQAAAGTAAQGVSETSGRLPAQGQRRTSSLPDPLRQALDKVTAKKQAAHAARLSDERLRAYLDDSIPSSGRATRALQREVAKRERARPQVQIDNTVAAAPDVAAELPVNETTEMTETSRTAIGAAAGGAPVGAAGAIARAEAPPLPEGTVFGADGKLNKLHLQQMIAGLIASLPPVPDSVTARHPTAGRLHTKLTEALKGIETLATADTKLDSADLGLAVRDRFAKASKTAKTLAGYLDREHVSGSGERRDALSYYLIAGFLTELKRTHLSAAAAEAVDGYAKREAKNLERVAPGLGKGVSGPNVSTATGGGLKYSAVVANGSANVTAGRTLFADDDRDVDFWTSAGIAFKGGAGDKLKNWTAGLTGQLALSGGGTYLEHDKLEELGKLIANYDANRSWITSAGPKTRKLVHGWERFRADASRLVGRNYVQSPGTPYFAADKKLEKGFNGVKMGLLATMLDEHLGERGERQSFKALAAKAYPAIGETLRKEIADEGVLPRATRDDVPFSVAYADGPLPFRQGTISVQADLGNATAGGTSIEAGGTFSLIGRADLIQFFTETANPPHQLLEPSHHKDFKATLGLHRQLDALCTGVVPPELHLYDTVRRNFGGGGPSAPFSDDDRKIYGDEAAIPAQFRDAISAPSAQRVERAAAEAERLGALYLNFVESGAQLLARPDALLPKAARPQLNFERAQAFRQLNDEIWNGQYPESKAMANPRAFIAESHAALSLALGAVGMHIGIQKERLAQRPGAGSDDTISRADKTYAKTRELFDKIYLPMKKYDVQKNGPLKEEMVWQRSDALVKLQASGGAKLGTLNSIAARWGKSLSPISVSNGAGNVTLSAEVKYLYADRQINPSRTGKFWQVTLTAQGGAPLTGLALQKAVSEVVKKINTGLSAGEPKLDGREVVRQIQGLALDVSDGSSVVLKFRQAPGAKMAATHLQYMRVLRNTSSGLDASVSIPTHVGMFTPSITHTDSTQGLEGEVMGTDLSYLIMQHPRLTTVLAHEDARSPEGLVKAFDANPGVRNGYFGHPTTIVDMVSRYAEFWQAKEAAAAGGPALPEEAMNEFHRYHEHEPFARAAELSRYVAHFAPGSASAAGAALPRPLNEKVSLDGIDLVRAKDDLSKLATIDARVRYFAHEGRPLLDAFVAIVQNMREINSAAMNHTETRDAGARAMLRNEHALRRQGRSAPMTERGGGSTVEARASVAAPAGTLPETPFVTPAGTPPETPFATPPESPRREV